MISNKVGTQNFSKAVQNHDFHDDPNVHYAAALPEEKGGSTKPVGELLNQIASPNGRESDKHVRKAHNTLDKDDFLKLMLTQMKNQDPTNPMQSHEMAAQLAQFTSLEQLFNVNKNLEGLQHSQDPMQKYEVLNFLGKTIKSDTRQIIRTQGDQGTDLRFNLMGDTTKVKITIADETGQTQKVLEYGGLKKGSNKVVWTGQNDKEQEVKPGKYIFNVEAFNSSGKKVGVGTETSGTITGVNYSPEGPLLMVGDQKVRLQDIQKIEDEGLKTQQNMQEQLQLLNPQGAAGEGKAPAGLTTGPATGPASAAALQGGNAAIPQSVLDNLSRQLTQHEASRQNSGQGAETQRTEQREFIPRTPQPLPTEASNRPKVKPEDRPEAKLQGDILPLEVASANSMGTGHLNSNSGINTGGAFGRK